MAKDREVDAYRIQLDQVRAKENRLSDLLLDGTVDGETFKAQQARLRDEHDRLFGLLQTAQREIDSAYLFTAERILELTRSAKTIWFSSSPEERRNFVFKLLQNATLDGATVRFELKKPLQVLSEMRQNDEWRARPDSNR